VSDHPDLSPSHGARWLQDWSLNVLKRMAAAVLVSGSVSIASHLFCMHAILLVHGGFRPLLGSQADIERVRISRFSCFKAWRSCSESWGQHCKFHQQSFWISQSSGTAYHVADIVAELAGLVFIVGILRPEMPDLLPPEARSMRGASRLLEECSSESVLWNAKVQESSACVVQWFVPSKLLF